MERTHSTIIFSKGDIQRPVQRVFNAPVLPNGSRNFGTFRRQTAELELNFMGGFILQMRSSFNYDNRLKSYPCFCLMEGGKLVDSYIAPGNVNVKSMTTCEGNHLFDME